MKQILARPGFLGTYGTLGGDLSYLLAFLFTIIFLLAWYAAKKHMGNTHHGLTLWGMVAMLIYFISYYFVRRLGVLALEGREGFGGSDWVYNYVFRPTLFVHILLVSLGIFIAIYMIVLGFRASSKVNSRRFLKEEALQAKKKNFYITLLSILTILGVLTFVRCSTFRCVVVYIVGFILVGIIFIFEKLIEKLLPNGAKRHRLIGRFTMIIYVLLLVTSTMTYFLLYIVYTPKLAFG